MQVDDAELVEYWRKMTADSSYPDNAPCLAGIGVIRALLREIDRLGKTERIDIQRGTKVIFIDKQGVLGSGACQQTFTEDGVRKVEIIVDDETFGTQSGSRICILPLAQVGYKRFQ